MIRKNYTWYISWKDLKRVPLKYWLASLIFLLIIILFAAWLATNRYVTTEMTECMYLTDYTAKLTESSRKQRHPALMIESKGNTYSISFPYGYMGKHRALITSEIVDSETPLEIQFVRVTDWWDSQSERCEIVGLRSESTVFYTLSDENAEIRKGKILCCIFILVTVLVEFIWTFLMLSAYGVLKEKRKKSAKSVR